MRERNVDGSGGGSESVDATLVLNEKRGGNTAGDRERARERTRAATKRDHAGPVCPYAVALNADE